MKEEPLLMCGSYNLKAADGITAIHVYDITDDIEEAMFRFHLIDSVLVIYDCCGFLRTVASNYTIACEYDCKRATTR